MNEKKTYSAPMLTVHGDVEKITQAHGNVSPKDVPHGNPDSAYAS